VFRRRRRRTRRESAGWLGRYLFETGGEHEWARCRVLDVSAGGVGLELPGVEVGAGIELGGRVVVDLRLVRSTMARLTLTGEVRHVAAVDDGVRIGLRFVEVGELERVLLLRLVARQKHEHRTSGVVVPLRPSRAD
jgi:c-di-GMP-binding flagellar brake protein YcgR